MMRLTIDMVTGTRILAFGAVLALMVMAAGMVLAVQPAHASTTFTVNSTGDKNDLDFPGGVFDGSLDGKCFTGSVLVVQGEECTLRAAIQEANRTRGANDPDDADTGPNNLQNKSLLSSARKNSAGTTTVRGTLDSTPNATFRVEVFSNPKGTDEGKTPLGSVIVSTNGAGDASLAFSTSKTIKLEQNITATATGPGGNTSEFSAPKKVVAG